MTVRFLIVLCATAVVVFVGMLALGKLAGPIPGGVGFIVGLVVGFAGQLAFMGWILDG